MVVGAITQIYNPEVNLPIVLLVFLIGIFVSVRFYKIACSILKNDFMEALLILFVMLGIVAVGYDIWLHTDAGKRWIDSL